MIIGGNVVIYVVTRVIIVFIGGNEVSVIMISGISVVISSIAR